MPGEDFAAGAPVRRLVVWCPDWPVVAATTACGFGSQAAAAVFTANRVLACSEAARAAGVRRGMRRREAQGRCPELAVCEHDPDRDARLFEPVVAAVEALIPGVEIVRPGLLAMPARGPARYFGAEGTAAERIVDQVDAHTGVECQVGAADGLFAGELAARRGVLVPPGGSPEFLAPLGIGEVDQPAQQAADRADLVDLLRRLGIRTLGEFAALTPADVSTRFGGDALLAHRAARGAEERPPDRRTPPPDLVVEEHLDPPVERVDAAAFAARGLAERLHVLLSERGVGCTRLGISARTEHGERLHRVWRCAEPLSPAGTVDRVRWQLDGWLSGRGEQRPTAGVSVLSLHPEEVVGAGGLQLDLMRSATGEADSRAGRAFVRVQGMIGPDRVLVGAPAGGRDVRDLVTLVPWGDERSPRRAPDRPWPGRIPAPSPSVVPGQPWPATVLDADGEPVSLTARFGLSAEPHRVVVHGRSRTVAAWAGPWPLQERWWTTPGVKARSSGANGSFAPEGAGPDGWRPGASARWSQGEAAPDGEGGFGVNGPFARASGTNGSFAPEGSGAEGAGSGLPGVARMQVVLAAEREAGRGTDEQGTTGQGTTGQGATGQGGTGQGGTARGITGRGGTVRGITGQGATNRGVTGRSTTDRGATGRSTIGQGTAGQATTGQESAEPDPDDPGEVALLLVRENGAWWVQGVYR